MSVDEEVIERLVGRVMEQLKTRSIAVRPSPVEVHNDQANSGPRETSNGMALTDAVITGELLEQRFGGEQRINIGPRSILTPSAYDVLKSKHIEWSRQPAGNSQTGAVSRWKAIIVQSTPGLSTVLDDLERSGDLRWERELAGDASEAVALAVSGLCRAEAAGVAVFAEDAASIVCRANRNRLVRAAVVGDVQAVAAVGRQMGANLVGIHPAGKSYFELRNMLRAFTADGPPWIPQGWDE